MLKYTDKSNVSGGSDVNSCFGVCPPGLKIISFFVKTRLHFTRATGGAPLLLTPGTYRSRPGDFLVHHLLLTPSRCNPFRTENKNTTLIPSSLSLTRWDQFLRRKQRTTVIWATMSCSSRKKLHVKPLKMQWGNQIRPWGSFFFVCSKTPCAARYRESNIERKLTSFYLVPCVYVQTRFPTILLVSLQIVQSTLNASNSASFALYRWFKIAIQNGCTLMERNNSTY